MSNQGEEIKELLHQLRGRDCGHELMQVVIVSVEDDGTCTVVRNPDEPLDSFPGFLPLIDAYVPAVDDTVWVLKFGSDKFILGRTTGGPSRSNSPLATFTNAPYSATSGTLASTPLTEVDSDPLVSLVGGTTIRPLKAGLWSVEATHRWAADVTGERYMEVVHTDSTRYVLDARPPALVNDTIANGQRHIRFDGISDGVDFRARHTSGGSLTTQLYELVVRWVRP